MYQLFVKNMVCDRCKAAVRRVFMQEGLRPASVDLGVVVLDAEVEPDVVARIADALEAEGFELLCDRSQQTVERIRTLVIEAVRQGGGSAAASQNMSAYLADRLHSDYSALSKLFSAVTGTTIEKFAISQKVEMVKELLSYGEMSLTEIASRMGYSSVAYLSAQFKSVTGVTPSAYKAGGAAGRRELDRV